MGVEHRDEPDFREPVSTLAPAAIEDDRQYRAVIAILDRLFALGDRRTPAESDTFRALARVARDYEIEVAPVRVEILNHLMTGAR